MASRQGPPKRKWGENHHSNEHGDGGFRTSPHRPSDLSLAQQGSNTQNHSDRGYHGRGRSARGGRGRGGGRGYSRSPQNSPNGSHFSQRTPNTPQSASSLSQQQQPQPETRETAPAQPAPAKAEPARATRSTQTPPRPSTPPAPYAYTYLTDAAIQAWSESGRQAVLEAAKKELSDDGSVVLAVIYQEIIRSALDRRLDTTEAGTLVKDVVASDINEDSSLIRVGATSCFLDNVAIGEYRESELSALKALLVASEIPTQQMRVEFDVDFLTKIGLVRETFNQMRARHQTNLLYRQSNYNLLREETEGYSKLITELFASSGGEPPNSQEVSSTYERVRSMIGTFDLDIGRVLDIHLDVFAAVLVRHYRYFVKYLRISSWWPEQSHLDNLRSSDLKFNSLPSWALAEHNGYYSPTEDEKAALAQARTLRDVAFWEKVRSSGMKVFFELGGARVDSDQAEALIPGEGTDVEERRAWAKATGLIPPSGNKVAAQILGFKLRFYSSDARSPTDVLPANLVHLAALLIKIGFISLVDLYPHLWPYDDAMPKVQEQKMQEKQEREMSLRPGGGRLNALAMAGSLGDEPGPAPQVSRLKEEAKTIIKPETKTEDSKVEVEAEPKVELPEAADQKVQLLKSLLCIGALPEALYILGRFPWLMDVYPDLPEYIHRILHHCLTKVYHEAHSIGDIHEAQSAESYPDLDQSGVAKGSIRLSNPPATKVLRWPVPDKYDPDVAVEYRFYWEDWTDNIPICQSVDDFFTLCSTFLNLVGLKIGQDCLLLSKIARIGRFSLANDSSEANRKRWMDLSKRLILPSLSLTKNNSGAVAEIWELIKQFPLSTRYNMYAEWFTGQTSRLSDMKSAFDLTSAETKDVLKRISKTNMKSMARALSKISTASPGTVFSVALNQIESYENLIDVIVECARYFTFLSYDILTWTLMSALGASGRNRVQADGMLRSKWLNALATFAGKVFKRYSIMSPTPILQYVANQLGRGNTTDLIVLEELTSSMAGIVTDAMFNDSQIVAMGGGPLLQGQVMLQLLDRRHESAMKSTSRRLMKSLIEPKLVGPLLISMAQEWQTCIYRVSEENANLKVLANLFDETQRILVQYLELLRSNLSMKEFNSLVPSFTQLIAAYGLESQIAFWISRPSISAEMLEHDKRGASEKKEASQSKTTNSEVPETQLATAEEDTEVDSNLETATKNEDVDTEMKDASAPKASEPEQPWHPVLKGLVDNTASFLPAETWNVLNQHFYFTFWQLSLEDIFVPMGSYDEENNRLKRKVMAINSDRSDLSSRGKEKKDEEKKAITDLQSRLQTELGVRIAAYQRTKQRITREKDLWFVDCHGKWDDLNVAILEHCFIPRIRLSSIDALYTFKIFKHLHSIGTKNFRTVGLLDQFFNSKRLSALIYTCTAREAENLGKFINELIKELARWHADKSVYEKEAYGSKKDLPGFKAKTGDKGVSELMDFESFRRILGKWHNNLHNALKSSLSGGEYMHIRNAINVLKVVSASFPAINWMGQSELAIVTDLGKVETREDLKLSAMSLLGSLKRREKSWVMPQAFMLSTNKPSVTNQTPASSRGKSPAVVDKTGAKSQEAVSDSKAATHDGDATLSTIDPVTTDVAPTVDGNVNGTDQIASDMAASQLAASESTQDTQSGSTTPAVGASSSEKTSQSQSKMPPPTGLEKTGNGSLPPRPQRATAAYNQTRSAPGSAPPTPPTDGSEASAVHPDRLRAIQGPSSGLPPRPTSSSSGSGVQRSAHGQASSQTNTRGGNAPQYNGNDRGRDKRFANLNTILQQPGQASAPERGGANIRGQASRSSNLPQSQAANTPPSRYGPPSNANLPPRPEQQPPRKELINNHNSSGPGFREEGRHPDRDTERRSQRPRDTRSASPRRPPAFEGGHPPSSREDGGRSLRSREEPVRGRPPQSPAERDSRRPPREDVAASYPPVSRETRRGPPREEHPSENHRDRERHPPARGGPPPPERDDGRSLRSRDEPLRRLEPEPRELRPRSGPQAPPPERQTRRGPPRDDHAERERYPPRGGPPAHDDYGAAAVAAPADTRERERYPPGGSRGAPPPQMERDEVRGGLRHRDDGPGRREADMRELRSGRPGPALSSMEREGLPPRRGPPLRDDHGGHGHLSGAESDREMRDRTRGSGAAGVGGALREPGWGPERMPPERGHPRDQRSDMGHRGRGEQQGHRRDGPMMDGRGSAGGMEDGGSGRKRARGMAEEGYGEQKRTRR